MPEAVGKALTLLALLGGEPDRAFTVSEAARRTGLTAPTAVRLLKALARAGFADQAGPRQGYRLGPAVYAMAARGRQSDPLLSAARAPVERLARVTGEAALLSTLSGGRRMVLLQATGQQDVQVRLEGVSQVPDPFVTATGRLLLAFVPDEEWRMLLHERAASKRPAVGAFSAARLERERRRIRAEELAYNFPSGIVGIAAPVRRDEHVAAAVGIYLPSFRFTGAHKSKVIRELRRSAEEISLRLSATGKAGDNLMVKGTS